MRGCIGNPAAGFRRLGARRAMRLSERITDGLAGTQAADAMLLDVLRLLEQQHRKLRSAEAQLVEANRILSEAEYVAPAEASMVAVAA